MDDAFRDIFVAAVPQVRDLAEHVRRFILTTLPQGIVEVPKPDEQIVAFGVHQFKTEKGEPEQFAWVGAFPDKVTLGFFNGALLPDPGGLLKGEGPIRRMDITDVKELNDPELKELLLAAYRLIIEGPTASQSWATEA